MHAADRPEPCSVDTRLLRAESDKADMDVESFSDGYLGGVVIDEGGIAAVGASGMITSQSLALICEHFHKRTVVAGRSLLLERPDVIRPHNQS